MTSSGRPPWSEVRARLDAAGFHPSRRLGQNFLRDENLLRAIVRDADVAPSDTVLEVGPGCGFLTLELARAARDVICVEIDARLLALARDICAAHANIRWIEGDVLAGKHRLEPRVLEALPRSERWKLVSNLPYSVSAPLLAVLAGLANPPSTMTVLVQKEVAERIAAAPGSSDWGPLSVRLQLDHDVRTTRAVPAQLFWPQPQVESTVVHLERRPAEIEARDREALDALVELVFQHRRQALGRVLADAVGRAAGDRVLGDLGVDPKTRGETLAIAELVRLAHALPAGWERATERPGRRSGTPGPGRSSDERADLPDAG